MAMDEKEKAALAEKIKAKLKPKKLAKLINYELYCRTCFIYFEKPFFDNEACQPFACKNGHQTIRLIAMYQISVTPNLTNIFEESHTLAYNENKENSSV